MTCPVTSGAFMLKVSSPKLSCSAPLGYGGGGYGGNSSRKPSGGGGGKLGSVSSRPGGGGGGKRASSGLGAGWDGGGGGIISSVSRMASGV